ncbi:SRPBCC family protein [Kribbella sp. NPDC054772]
MTEPLIVQVRAQAGLDEVRQALTDPKALNLWLGEYSTVDLPGTFEFWGRHIPDGDAPHQRVLAYDGNTLKLAWTLGGEETTTEITLIPESDTATVIKVDQSHFDFADAISGANIRGVLQSFWSLALANLVDHLAGRELTTRPDFTSTVFEGEALIDAAIADVYSSMTDSERASAWMGYPVGIDLAKRRFAMGGFDVNPGVEIVDLVEGRKMSMDWGDGGISTWELEDSGGKTRLTFVISGFDEDNPPYGAWIGWLSGAAALRRYHELPDWDIYAA